MSRTEAVPQKNPSPAKITISYNGKLGNLSYKKEAKDKDWVTIPLPFTFVVIDADASKVGGTQGTGKNAPRYSSNIAHPKYSVKLRITKDGNPIKDAEKWIDVSKEMYAVGARYVKMIYILTKIEGERTMACLQLKGRAVKAWFDLLEEKELDPCGPVSFKITKTVLVSGEGDDSLVPVFEVGEVTPETVAQAEDMDRVLQGWFREQFAIPLTERTDDDKTEDLPAEPAQQNIAAAAPPPPAQAAAPKSLAERVALYVTGLWENPDRATDLTYQQAVQKGFALMVKNYSPTNADRKAAADILYRYGLVKKIYFEHEYSGIDLEGTLIPLDLPF